MMFRVNKWSNGEWTEIPGSDFECDSVEDAEDYLEEAHAHGDYRGLLRAFSLTTPVYCTSNVGAERR